MGQGWAQPTMVRGSLHRYGWHEAEGRATSVSLFCPEDGAWATQGHPFMISRKQPLASDKR